MKNKFHFFLLLLVCLFGFNENLSAQKRKSAPRKIIVARPAIIQAVPAKLSPEQQRRFDAFNFTWQTISDNYFDQTFSGLDWNKIKKEYEPRVLKAVTDSELHDILQEMINRLDRSHFAVIPPEVYLAIENAKAEAKAKEDNRRRAAGKNETPNEDEIGDEKFDFTDYSAKHGIGVELRLMENQFVVTRVEANSAAEKAGLKTGYVVEKINDVSLAELLKQIDIYYAKVRNIKKYLSGEVVEYMLNGKAESLVAMTVLDETGQPKEFRILRERLKGETISIGENYPEQFLQFETASLNEQTGYVKFNIFALPVIEKFCAALTELKDKRAIIIDLRGNTGGILGIMVGLGGMLTEKSVDLGTSIYKIGSERMVAESKAKNYKGRLVFLVDNQTASAAEIFAAALQENNRALIVGEKTAGEALPSLSVQLPTGAILLYPIANFKTRNGNYLEGKGVSPNIIVAQDRKSLLTGKDVTLETALKIIKEDTQFPKPLEEKPEIIVGSKPPPPAAPPKPIAGPKVKALGEITVKAPLPPALPVLKKDEKALQVIADFMGAVGGEANLNKINSYELSGTSEITSKGTKTGVGVQILRQKPDKYAEIMKSEAVGEIRQIYSGKNIYVQTDYGLNSQVSFEVNTANIEIFAPLSNLSKKDFFKSLTYQGAFDRLGRKAHVVEAVTADNQTVALAFDVETKMLVSYAGLYFTFSYEDYRRVENVTLPFHIVREPYMDIKLDKIKLNPPLEAGQFTPKENCFDKAN